jgi:hypothetical protein
VANAKGETNSNTSKDELGKEFEVLLVDIDIKNLNIKPPIKGTT